MSWHLAPDDMPVLPRLLGQAPETKQASWGALECYVPGEDRYHTANGQGHGIENPGGWRYPSCRLSCPCTEPPPPSEGALRLVGGPSAAAGRLEIYHEGAWGTVCDDGFSDVDAQVACAELGLHGGFEAGVSDFGEGHGAIWLASLGCRGSEDSLLECPHSGWGTHRCDHTEDVGIVCSEVMSMYDQMRRLLAKQPDPSRCWSGGYLPFMCCHPSYGPGGNPGCWTTGPADPAVAFTAECCNEANWTELEVQTFHQALQVEWQRRCDAQREVHIYDDRPPEWMGALSQELLFWFGWLRQAAYLRAPQPHQAEFWRGTDPAAQLDASVRELLLRARAGWPWPWRSTARVLNVGSGALNDIGHEWPGVDVEVVAADALACEYAQMRQDLGIRAKVAPVPAEVEGLVQRFGGGSFDAAVGSNFLDHAHDPLSGLRQMVRAVRRGGRVLLSHRRNEGETQRYSGLHQWNIDAAHAGGTQDAELRLRIWRPARIGLPAADLDAARELAGEAEVQVKLVPGQQGQPEMVEAELVRL